MTIRVGWLAAAFFATDESDSRVPGYGALSRGRFDMGRALNSASRVEHADALMPESLTCQPARLQE